VNHPPRAGVNEKLSQEVTGLETVATKKLYEAMFLVDSALATADWDGTVAFINNIFARAEAEVVVLRKWQERKLTYDIGHKSRGTYILAYFKVDGRKVGQIEKDVLLSEKIMRVLILTTEDRPSDLVEKDIKGELHVPPPELTLGAEPPERERERRPRYSDSDEAAPSFEEQAEA
jgi:small subunit ribosomal protein S6